MLRDVFYFNQKPNVHPREKFATSIEDARQQCTTEHFWIINEYCDYHNFDWDFDFEFLPDEDVWAEEHNNVWPSQHQKDSGTWLCSSAPSEVIIYRADVDPIRRKRIKNDNWVLLDLVDETKFDFSWHPDPSAPPYIYTWGCKFFPVELQACLEYHVLGATTIKYMSDVVELLSQDDRWIEVQAIDKSKFDMSWRPNPLDPPMNYVWGNKYIDGTLRSTLEYHTPGATDIKYMPDLLTVEPEQDKWVEVQLVDKAKFDFSWRPDPREPAYVYTWGNKYIDAELIPTLEYHCEGATERKYMGNDVTVLPEWNNWIIPKNLDTSKFDFTWRPDPREPAFTYEFGTQWQKTGGPKYVCTDATETKYVDFQKAKALANSSNWTTPSNIDSSSFDFSWHPDATSPPYIYRFPTQWAMSGGPTYTVHGATEIKYVDVLTAKATADKTNWSVPSTIDIDSFDFSWHPYVEDEPYIYQFGTQWQKTGGPRYITPGTHNNSPVKYIDTRIIKSNRLPVKEAFTILDDNVIDNFDYSWHPDETEEPYIYQFGNNQYPAEIMPTIEYAVSGATQIKYVTDIVATLGKNKNNWEVIQPINEDAFDFSWKPNPKDPPYVYAWGNKYISNKYKSTIEYHVEGATETKYMDELVEVIPELDKWVIPANIDDSDFDYTWRPDPLEPDLIWQFGTQWQKTDGPRYVVPGATEIKYLDTQKVKILASTQNWSVPSNIDIEAFDFSWHPDDTSPPYIYQFGTQWAMSGGPRYIVDNATEIKYIDSMIAKATPNKANWEVDSTLIDVESFDFSWHPYIEDEPYIYQFGTQWQKTGGPKYITPGTHANSSVKYIDTRIIKSKRLPDASKFNIVDNNIVAEFDYSWHPDASEEPYVYVFGNNQYPAEMMPTVEYVVSGATQIKYINDIVAMLGANENNWVIPDKVDTSEFDFSWVPNPKDPDYVYEFGTQWQKTGGPKYVVGNATEVKYVDGSKAKTTLVDMSFWSIPKNINIDSFDFSWHPDATSPPYIYNFATQWALGGGPVYTVPNAIEKKYIEEQIAITLPNRENWEIPDNIDADSFDFSWHPYIDDQPYIYHFGTQWQKTGGPKYITPGTHKNSPVKYIDTRILKAKRLPNKKGFTILDNHVISEFDYSWHPDETDELYVYVFGNTQYPAETMPTIEYAPENVVRLSSGKAIGQIKYVNDVVATLGDNKMHWVIPNNVDVTNFDFSWVPNPHDPLYTYQFGTVLDRDDGPRYMHPDTISDIIVYSKRVEKLVKVESINTVVSKYEIETTLADLVKQHPNEIFWAMHKNIEYEGFNFDWRPEIINIQWENEYVYVFGSTDSETTQTYFVNANMYLKGNTDFKFVQTEELTEKYLSTLFKKSDMFFVDRSNSESQTRFEKLKQRFPGLQKTRYLNSWVDTINRCINRSTTELCWILNSELDYSDFDFDFYPSPWQMKMVQVFGTQWSHWGTTFMVNRETFAQDTKFIKIIEHLSTLNFVKDRKAKATNVLYDIVYIDHGNMDMTKIKQEGKTVIKYQNSYITTFQKMLDILPVKKEHYIWIASTVCDYSSFDFTYICDPFAKEQLHVFPSDRQKFGDTFLVDVNKLRTLIEDMNVLEDYEKINYNQSQRANRLPAPMIITDEDTHVNSINTVFDFPYAVFTTSDNKNINVVDTEPMSLWTPESKNIQITSVGGTRIVVPKEAKEYVKRELYDYPYITTNSRLAKSAPLDIVFFSNGEASADSNYEHLLKITNGLPNKITRIDGVSGRVNSQHAAANSSDTAWYFLVNAKLKVNSKFDFNWQPDRLQIPKHYIFHAANPVNGLRYGHQAIVANNKKLTLANLGNGLDFTMDSEHEIIKLNSGIAVFNTSAWDTWRTAFRECVKLKASGTDENKERLEMWLTVGMGEFNEYSMEGAQHAVEYYDEVNGDFDKLKLSYDWPWLRARFDNTYSK